VSLLSVYGTKTTVVDLSCSAAYRQSQRTVHVGAGHVMRATAELRLLGET
jgi:hypothetical protein